MVTLSRFFSRDFSHEKPVIHFSFGDRYHISINRIGNIGQLTVLPANLPPGEEADTTPVSGASPAGFSKMDLLPTDTLWIGEAVGMW